LARYIYLGKGNIPAEDNVQRTGFQKWAYNKFYVDELYHFLFTKPVDKLSVFIQKFLDTKLVDGLVNGFGKTTIKGGTYIRTLQSGNINSYAILFILAISFFLLIIFI
ncbi:MAG: NADH-quinone oxidoreductase subunit L, partial [Bacteroidia bacterium]|nr:NADH-quinone oxidoreductase subunit L [Bacteroidia bacterium]